jgi:hypothetical protein
MNATAIRGGLIALAASGATILPLITASRATGRTPGAERITISGKTVGDKASPNKVRLVGPIHGTGTMGLRSSPDNRVDHMTLRLHHGSIYLVAIEKSFAVHPNPSQCNATATGQGTFTITGGTRAFRGTRGHGTYKRHAVLVGSRSPDGTCLGQNAPLAATYYKLTMTGKVTLP